MTPVSVRELVRLGMILVVIECSSIVAYLTAASLGNYVKVYRSLGVASVVPFAVVQIVFIGIAQTVLMTLLFFWWRRRRVAREPHPSELISSPEHERLERKATLRFDLKQGGVNRALERSVMKTVAAFLNSSGGHLLVGVGDDGSVIGLEHDFATLVRKDVDGWETHFSNVLASMIGPSFRQSVSVRHFSHQGKACALISVHTASRPAYLSDEGREEFFVRTGNGTTALKMSEAHAYIGSRFRRLFPLRISR